MTTYYVSTSGNESGNGSANSPWKTISQAMKAKLQPGDEVVVKAGTYREAVTVQKDGSANDYITIRSEVPGGAKIDASGTNKIGININANYVTIEGFEVTGSSKSGIGGSAVHHVEVIDNISHDNATAGIYLQRSDYLTIDGNKVFDNASSGPSSGISIHNPQNITGSNSNSGYRIIVSNNESYNNVAKSGPHTDGNGIILDDFKSTKLAILDAYNFGALVQNNLVYGNGGEGIQVYNSDNATIKNNTVWHNSVDPATNSQWRAELSNEQSSGTIWVGNIAVADPGINKYNMAIEVIATNGYSSKGVVWRDNLTFNGKAGDASIVSRGGEPLPTSANGNLLGVDPKFVSAPSNFHLKSGSPALEDGMGAFGEGTGGVLNPTPEDPTTDNVFSGNSGNNVLVGSSGDDTISGFGGKDHLTGGSGDDVLRGGSGKDTMVGGAGDDVFDFDTKGHAGVGSGRDIIQDFADGDMIDLSGIDASSSRSGDQAFSFIGLKAFSGTAGQLQYVDGIVAGDINGDRSADFHIDVANDFRLDANDFLL